MADTHPQIRAVLPAKNPAISLPPISPSIPIEPSSNRLRTRSFWDSMTSPVNQNGSFEFDRVVKSGTVQKRTHKTKTWKPAFLVLRPNALFIYKNEKENKLRHKVHLTDVTAVALLKDPKHKRDYVFGCFSPSKNYHFQANNGRDALEWVDLIRTYARIDEVEEELLLGSPVGQRTSFLPSASPGKPNALSSRERVASSSPEPSDLPASRSVSHENRRPSNVFESSGYSGNELASYSDFSDNDMQRLRGMSIENLAVQALGGEGNSEATSGRPQLAHRNSSQVSGLNIENDPDRVIWQGWLWFLRNKGGVRQWKKQWGVLRPRNFILYKDESEYSALFVRPLSAIVDVVDIDPVSRNKVNCLQIITEEKSYRFCAADEESLVRCLGAFKSLMAKRRELEARAAAAAAGPSTSNAP